MQFLKGIEALHSCDAWGWGCGRVTCFGELLLHIYTETTTLPASCISVDIQCQINFGLGSGKSCNSKGSLFIPREEREVLL